MIDLDNKDDREAAAGEYVLGTLGAEDTAAVAAAMLEDTALRAEVYAWQDRLLALTARAAAATPRPQLWQRIDTRLNAIAAAAPRPPARHAARPPWWMRLGLWQGTAALALAASLFMAVLLVQRAAEPTGTRYLALLQSPDKQSTGWVVEVQAGASLRLVPVAEMAAVPAGRALQFWTKLEGAAGPTSLGLVRAGETLKLPVSRLPGVAAQQLFEITLEPENGSPIGRPTGPILYLGRSVAL